MNKYEKKTLARLDNFISFFMVVCVSIVIGFAKLFGEIRLRYIPIVLLFIILIILLDSYDRYTLVKKR